MISIVKQEIVMASELQHLPTLEGLVTLADRPLIYPVTQNLWLDVAAAVDRGRAECATSCSMCDPRLDMRGTGSALPARTVASRAAAKLAQPAAYAHGPVRLLDNLPSRNLLRRLLRHELQVHCLLADL